VDPGLRNGQAGAGAERGPQVFVKEAGSEPTLIT